MNNDNDKTVPGIPLIVSGEELDLIVRPVLASENIAQRNDEWFVLRLWLSDSCRGAGSGFIPSMTGEEPAALTVEEGASTTSTLSLTKFLSSQASEISLGDFSDSIVQNGRKVRALNGPRLIG